MDMKICSKRNLISFTIHVLYNRKQHYGSISFVSLKSISISIPPHLLVVGGSERANFVHCHQQVWVYPKNFPEIYSASGRDWPDESTIATSCCHW